MNHYMRGIVFLLLFSYRACSPIIFETLFNTNRFMDSSRQFMDNMSQLTDKDNLKQMGESMKQSLAEQQAQMTQAMQEEAARNREWAQAETTKNRDWAQGNIDTGSNTASSFRDEMNSRLKSAQDSFSNAVSMDDLRVQFDEKASDLEDKIANASGSMKSNYQDQLDKLQEAYDSKAASLSKSANGVIDHAKEAVDEQQQKILDQLDIQKQINEDLKQQLADAKASIKSAANQVESDYTSAKSTVVQDYNSAKSSATQTNQQMTQAAMDTTASMQEQLAQLHAEMAELKKQKDAAMLTATTAIKDTAANANAAIDNTSTAVSTAATNSSNAMTTAMTNAIDDANNAVVTATNNTSNALTNATATVAAGMTMQAVTAQANIAKIGMQTTQYATDIAQKQVAMAFANTVTINATTPDVLFYLLLFEPGRSLHTVVDKSTVLPSLAASEVTLIQTINALKSARIDAMSAEDLAAYNAAKAAFVVPSVGLTGSAAELASLLNEYDARVYTLGTQAQKQYVDANTRFRGELQSAIRSAISSVGGDFAAFSAQLRSDYTQFISSFAALKVSSMQSLSNVKSSVATAAVSAQQAAQQLADSTAKSFAEQKAEIAAEARRAAIRARLELLKAEATDLKRNVTLQDLKNDLTRLNNVVASFKDRWVALKGDLEAEKMTDESAQLPDLMRGVITMYITQYDNRLKAEYDLLLKQIPDTVEIATLQLVDEKVADYESVSNKFKALLDQVDISMYFVPSQLMQYRSDVEDRLAAVKVAQSTRHQSQVVSQERTLLTTVSSR